MKFSWVHIFLGHPVLALHISCGVIQVCWIDRFFTLAKMLVSACLPFLEKGQCLFFEQVQCFISKSTCFIKCSCMWTKVLYKCACCFRVLICCYLQKLKSRHWKKYETIAITSNICKATKVTHTKRIYRNLLCKETSFVYYTSSVLRKSRHMKQKEKITHCC